MFAAKRRAILGILPRGQDSRGGERVGDPLPLDRGPGRLDEPTIRRAPRARGNRGVAGGPTSARRARVSRASRSSPSSRDASSRSSRGGARCEEKAKFASAPAEELAAEIEETWENRERLHDVRDARRGGRGARAPRPGRSPRRRKVGSDWITHAWVKKAILLHFSAAADEIHAAGPFEWRDRIPIKKGLEKAGVRAVPGAVVRMSAFVEKGAILMPSFVNVGARVGSGTMIDTWATVGSCAQVGRDCHVAGGVRIGGVLEPPRHTRDRRGSLFLGIALHRGRGNGARGGDGARCKCGVDRVDPNHRRDRPEGGGDEGRVPANSVVIPGTRSKDFPAGAYGVPCALIIGKRSAQTDRKTSLNAALRRIES